MTKQVIKVGDKIRIVSNSSSQTGTFGFGHYFAVGSVVTVKRLTTDGKVDYAEGVISCEHPRNGQTDIQFLREDHYELISTVIDFTKPVQTKDGESVEIITTNGRGMYPVLGFIGDNDAPKSFTVDGVYYTGENFSYDLENVPEKEIEIVRYYNIYPRFTSMGYASRAEADEAASSERIGCKRVAFTEGEFDD